MASIALPPLPQISKSRPNSNERTKSLEMENPFKLPGDDQIFRMREEERRMREEKRKKTLSLKLWEKSKTEGASTAERVRDILGEDQVLSYKEVTKNNQDNSKFVLPRRQEKENTDEFVAKKREMFLVQMSLDTKREEIRKLEEKAQMKEEALQRSEQMLEEDAMRFDAFLKENDKKAHDAIKKAEEETKKKQEKAQEIKRLTQQIQALSSEMSKHREALEDCMRYKKFLDMLTPNEWFEQYARKRDEQLMQLKQQLFDSKMKEYEKLKRKLIDQHRKEVEIRKEMKREKVRRAGLNRTHVDEEDEDETEVKLILPSAPKFEEETCHISLAEEEIPMYFKEPQQLMDIFSALEEQNLFLIQNSQETEHTLEELQHSYNETKFNMDHQTNILQEQINDLQHQISSEEAKIKSLLSKRLNSQDQSVPISAYPKDGSLSGSCNAEENQLEKEKLLNDLNNKVKSVYELCGFDASSKPTTLFMLSQMESKLEVLLQDIELMPSEYVIKSEKEKEKRRRERKREEQQAMQIKLQEERNKRAIERSMQAPKKRVGRQVMYRSKPLRMEEKKLGDDEHDKDNTDEMKYLS